MFALFAIVSLIMTSLGSQLLFNRREAHSARQAQTGIEVSKCVLTSALHGHHPFVADELWLVTRYAGLGCEWC
jgi:hypothetical protein